MANAFLAALETEFPSLKVEHYPDEPENYKLSASSSAILVRLYDRAFELPDGADGSGQINTPVFQITYISRSLLSKKQAKGMYALLDSGRDGLKKVTINDTPASILREFFVGTRAGGIWIYSQLWVITDFFD